VLNEFLPNPEGEEYGFDFGDDSDSIPQGEWVEIYNNGSATIDLAGWQIKDAGPDHTITISTTNTNSGSTVIGPKGSGNEWLVVYMNHSVLSNSGDTVSLYEPFGALVDSHSYRGDNHPQHYCDLIPTPDDPNNQPATGSGCTWVPGNKSYARIPDGTGSWFDPVPTPGRQNELEEIIPEEETPVEEELTIEENQEEGIIDEIVNEIVEEILPETEPTEEKPIIEENVPAIEEQPVDVANNNSDYQNVSAENSGDNGESVDISSESIASETSADSGSAAASGENVSQ
jgi:hypothetical protein